MVFVISGPSGCGKSTLIGRVLKELGDVRFSVSHTTRDKRKGETDGKEYRFISKKTFESMIREGMFAEWAVVHDHYYGTSRSEIETKGRDGDILLDIDVQGARQIRSGFGENAVFIFIMPPVFAELRRRLVERKTDDSKAIDRRLRNAREEIRAFREFDYVVINENLEKAVGDLISILRAAKCRADVRNETIFRILRSFEEKETEQ